MRQAKQCMRMHKPARPPALAHAHTQNRNPRQNPAENNSPEEKWENVKQTNKPRTPQPNVRTIDTTPISQPPTNYL